MYEESHAKRCKFWGKAQVEEYTVELHKLKEERLHVIVQKLKDLGWGENLASITYPDSLAAHT
ncbi:hypothetical protein CVT25_009789 [Psilocybe cyanescens]|uniref:Uncharacterized protein n=1 Tax=Psilocybe cyanescens TaxID=93625 RepID=A0A409X8D3_PSICY|nr:hypothetical protein CVT25_009789 [Psilocybe cyanescens]